MKCVHCTRKGGLSVYTDPFLCRFISDSVSKQIFTFLFLKSLPARYGYEMQEKNQT